MRAAPAASVTSWMRALQRIPFAWLIAFAASVLVLMAPAIWNRLPFMFYDTGAFIELAVKGGFKPERSAIYGSFLAVFWPRYSLWPAMVAQVLMVVLVMAAFARAQLPRLSPARFFALILFLCLTTVLPWNAAEVLPDILAPIMVLCLYLLGFHAAILGWQQKAVLAAVAVLAATSHASHLGLAAGLIFVIALMQLAMWGRGTHAVAPRAALPALVFALALLALVASNFSRTGDLFVSRSGPAFLLGRLVQDGIAKRLLDETCPGSGYRLCAYKDNLPRDANDFLWGWESPFPSLGGFEGMAGESRDMIVESLKRYPLMHLRTAAFRTLEQFVTFETGDGIEPLDEIPVPAIRENLPEQLADYRASRQQSSQIGFDWINLVQVPLGALSLGALTAVLAKAIRRRDWSDRAFLPAFLLIALLGNAFICGALSNPQHRYQSRMMWAANFVVILLMSGRLQVAVTWVRARLATARNVEIAT